VRWGRTPSASFDPNKKGSKTNNYPSFPPESIAPQPPLLTDCFSDDALTLANE
jgi:hypothetical protein